MNMSNTPIKVIGCGASATLLGALALAGPAAASASAAPRETPAVSSYIVSPGATIDDIPDHSNQPSFHFEINGGQITTDASGNVSGYFDTMESFAKQPLQPYQIKLSGVQVSPTQFVFSPGVGDRLSLTGPGLYAYHATTVHQMSCTVKASQLFLEPQA